MSLVNPIRVKFVNRGQTKSTPIQWLRQFPGRIPKWGRCQFIFDPSERNYDWLVVENDLPAQFGCKQSTATESLACSPEHTLFITREPSSVSTYGSPFLNQFRYVLTGHEDWALKHRGKIHSQPALRWYYGDSSRIGAGNIRDFDSITDNVPKQKSKTIGTMCSAKSQRHTMHSDRVKFVERLQKALPELDRFGEGFREIPDKAMCLDDYKYHIAIENHVCDHWWTEKLSDAFLGLTLPFYHGAPNAHHYFPKESFIPINIYDFEGSHEIIKNAIESGEYEKRIDAIHVARERCLYKYSTFPTVSKIIEQYHSSKISSPTEITIKGKHSIRENPIIALRIVIEKTYIRCKTLKNKLNASAKTYMLDVTKTKIYWRLKRMLRKYNIRKNSPSQYGQDQVAYELLKKPENGTFVDIGANDGVTFSNSLFFEKLNWTGVCIEPNPVVFQKLASTRSCEFLNVCISETDSIVDFMVVEGPSHMLSGISSFMDSKHLQRIDREIAANGGQKKLIKINAISPETLTKNYSIKQIDYLSIDTEGCEIEILKKFDFSEINVRVINVENGSRTPELFNYLNTVGYKLYKCIGCDEIYQKR